MWAYGVSLLTHMSFFCVMSLPVFPGFGRMGYVNKSVSLELLTQAPTFNDSGQVISIKEDGSKEIIVDPIPETRITSIPQLKNEKSSVEVSAPPKSEWNQADFQKKQTEIDKKIQTIRTALQKTIAAQKRHNKSARGFELISAGIDGGKWDQYLSGVRQKVFQGWYPGLLKIEKKLSSSEARLDFTVSVSGRVKEYKIVEWKGSPEFRDLCVRVFKESLPLSPLPKPDGAREKRRVKPVVISLFFYYRA